MSGEEKQDASEKAMEKLKLVFEYVDRVQRLSDQGIPPTEEFFEVCDLVETELTQRKQ